MYSTNPISKKKYKVPNNEKDSERIKRFLEKNKGKDVVVIQGLGFVGFAMALVVANSSHDYAVIGVDIPTKSGYWKIGAINDGDIPIVSSDPKIEEYFNTTKNKGNLFATHDISAFSEADVIIVDINLDVKKDSINKELKFDVDLAPFTEAIKSIAKNCKEDSLVLIETTVPPGTCLNIVKPIFKDFFKERKLDSRKLNIGHSYERVMPGSNYIDSIENFHRVYAGINSKSADSTRIFLESIIKTEEFPLTKLSNTNSSEMSKVLENSYRAMNIAFIQEWTEFAEIAEVNLYETIAGIKIRPTHSNIMKPGLGVGGYCLTKDPLLASWASQNIFNGNNLPQSERAVEINDSMPNHTFKRVLKAFDNDIERKKILILGVSYINDVGDTRYTPIETLYENLLKEGADISLHDPYLSYWNEKKLPILQKLPKNKFDILIITIPHKQFNEKRYFDYINYTKPELIVDTFGFYLNHIGKLDNRIKILTIGKG